MVKRIIYQILLAVNFCHQHHVSILCHYCVLGSLIKVVHEIKRVWLKFLNIMNFFLFLNIAILSSRDVCLISFESTSVTYKGIMSFVLQEE